MCCVRGFLVGQFLNAYFLGRYLISKESKIMTDITIHNIEKINSVTRELGAEAGGGFVRNLFIVTKDGTITLSLFSDKKDNFSANDYSSWIDAFSMSRLSYTSNQKVIPLKRVAAKGVEA